MTKSYIYVKTITQTLIANKTMSIHYFKKLLRTLYYRNLYSIKFTDFTQHEHKYAKSENSQLLQGQSIKEYFKLIIIIMKIHSYDLQVTSFLMS